MTPTPPDAARACGVRADLERRLAAHRREVHVHCYRMLGSFDEAEDAVQDTYLKAWRAIGTFEGDHGFRAWLYRIATNTCLDMIRARDRRPVRLGSSYEVGWLQPYPDRLLDEAAPPGDDPDSVAVARETIELAFLVAVQLLPPKQRAALLLRDVLGLSAKETADLLDTSVPATNSALQRARATMAEHLPSHRTEWSAPNPGAVERDLLDRFVAAHERGDAALALSLVAPDIRITMPPYGHCFEGVDIIVPLLDRAFGPDGEGDWRLEATWANRMPVAACYLRRPGDERFRAFKCDVLRIEDGRVAEITTFGWSRFPSFGLPEVLPPVVPG